MAITKILPVRGQLKGCLDYAANPQKTEYFSTADMQRLIGYTQNKDKTEHQLYVSGFNCMPQNAYSTLTAQRRALYRGKSKTTPADYSEQIQALTARIRELRREITTCADIEMDCEMVQDKVQRAAHRRENPPRERIHRRAY